ncbi:MAG: hypothetical protein ACJ8AO_03860 [Gemmatimonadaceae bacterium]
MGLFDFLKRPPGAAEVLHALVYADVPLERWPAILGSPHVLPADAPLRRLQDAAAAEAAGDRDGARTRLRAAADDPAAESRVRLLAWRGLRDLGDKPPADAARVPRGVVCEVALPHGLDVLGCYEDRTARLHGAAGNMVIWDARDPDIDARIDAVLAQAPALVGSIRAHGDLGLIVPRGTVALTALTDAGRHTRPEPLSALSGGRSKYSPLFAAATQLFVALVERAGRSAGGG